MSFWPQAGTVMPSSPAGNVRVTLLHYRCHMDALGWAVLILVLAAAVIRLIAAHPLFSTLGTCFANWAEESRSGDGRHN